MVNAPPTMELIREDQRRFGAGIRNVLYFRRDALGALRAVRQEASDVARFYMGPLRCNLFLTPELIGEVLLHPDRFARESRGFKAMRSLLGDGLLTSEGTLWRRQRRTVQPAFQRARIEGFASTMVTCAQELADRWQDGQRIDIAREMMRLTLRILGLTMFSADVERDAPAIGDAFARVLAFGYEIASNPFIALGLPTPRTLRIRKAVAELDRMILPIIASRRASARRPRDLLTMMLEACDPETGESMGDAQLRAETLTMFLGGHETTAIALSWTLMLLALHASVMRRLRAELDQALAADATVDIEHIARMPYLKAVVQESLRLYPPVWMVARQVQEPTRVGGFRLLRGEGVFLSPFLTHRDARYWPHPERFDPDRFLTKDPKRPKLAYFPFAAGSHQCIGGAFTMLEAPLLLATLLRRFEFELCPDHPIVVEPSITMRPKHGIAVQVHARRDCHRRAS